MTPVECAVDLVKRQAVAIRGQDRLGEMAMRAEVLSVADALETAPKPKLPLSRRQVEVLDAIRVLVRTRAWAPSYDEIGAAVGLAAVSGVHKHVEILERKGWLRRRWNQPRSIELVEGSSTRKTGEP